MGIRQESRPIGVDFRHVHPGDEGLGEGVVEAVFRVVDLGYAQDVVDVGDDRETGVGDEIGGGVTGGCALDVFVKDLDVVCGVAGKEAGVVEEDEAVDVAFGGGGDRVGDCFGEALDGNGAADDGLGWDRRELEGDVLLSLLDDIDFAGYVTGLGGL